MNQLPKDVMKAAIMGFVVPMLLLGMAVGLSNKYDSMPEDSLLSTVPTTQPSATQATEPDETTQPEVSEPTVPDASEPTEPEQQEPLPTAPKGQTTIKVLMDGTLRTMDLEEYLMGVVLSEIPASFSEEALKAQAVASRTYTLRCCTIGGNHEAGVICTNSGCCQAYMSPEAYITRGGSWRNVMRINEAVQQTTGQVLKYNGTLVLALYFSSSGGMTETAATVFGRDYPYLQTVESPGESFAEGYEYTVTYTAADFAAKFEDLTGDPETWIGGSSYTSGGGVKNIAIGSKVYTGNQVRSKLGLRSSMFTITAQADTVTVTTWGYGHRVGMSQYGAEAMARNGYGYLEILTHYYIGTTIEQYEP